MDDKKYLILQFDKPEKWLGVTIETSITSSHCIGYEPYKNKKGESTFILRWISTSKKSGLTFAQTTPWKLNPRRLLNHETDRNPAKVLAGKLWAKNRKDKEQ